MTAAAPPSHYIDALRERARRELLRRRQDKLRNTPLQDWLGEVSPQLTWDWPHLVYVQKQLARITSGEIHKLMLFMPPRHGKCLAEGSLVLLANGREVPIERVAIGDVVVTLSHDAQPTTRPVTAVADNGVRHVRRLIFQSGRTLTCTDNHPLLTVHGWQAASDLQVGDGIAAHRSLPTDEGSPLPEGFAALLGYLVGDGAFTTGDVSITTADPAVSTHLEHIAATHGWVVRRGGRYTHRVVKPTRHGRGRVLSAREAIRPYMAPAGAYTKRVPPDIFTAGTADIAAFLAAYFNSDGTVNTARDGSAEFYSVSEDLLRDVQRLLLRLGVQSRLRQKRGRYLGKPHLSWRLTVSGDDVVTLADWLPVIGERGKRLGDLVEQILGRRHYPEYNAIPAGWKRLMTRSTSWHRQTTGVRVDKVYQHGTARHVVQAVAEAEDNAALRWVCSDGLVWDRLVAVEDAGEQPTYDIEVADTHNFSVDGLVVHNSLMTTVHYPIYRMERDLSLRVMLGCYNQDLANLFSRQARRLAYGRGLVGGGIKAQDEWDIVGGGSFRAASIGGGGVTGRGANLIIIDDPIRSREDANSLIVREKAWEWYTTDVYTRLEPGGSIILILTRWHNDDLAGRILASEDGPNWTVCSLPAEAEEADPIGREVGEALCPERFDLDALRGIKQVLGVDYYALYQQRPVAEEGGLYQRAWFKYEQAPKTPQGEYDFDQIVQAWDTASSQVGDYSACITVGVKDNHAYVLDVYRARLETPDLLRQVKNLAERWRPTVLLVEDASSGIAVTQMLKRETRLPILGIPPNRGGKLAHAKSNLPYLEGGRVSFCPGAYLVDFEHELLSFPAVIHDDQVDALNLALTRIFGQGAPRRAGSHSGSATSAPARR